MLLIIWFHYSIFYEIDIIMFHIFRYLITTFLVIPIIFFQSSLSHELNYATLPAVLDFLCFLFPPEFHSRTCLFGILWTCLSHTICLSLASCAIVYIISKTSFLLQLLLPSIDLPTALLQKSISVTFKIFSAIFNLSYFWAINDYIFPVVFLMIAWYIHFNSLCWYFHPTGYNLR